VNAARDGFPGDDAVLGLRPATARVLAFVYLGLGGYLTLGYLYITSQTITYPYLLEWLEGGVADTVARLVRGLPMYVEPTYEYVAFNYPPLYFHVAAQVARWTGPGLPAPRLVSFVASLGVAWLVWMFVRRDGRSHLAAWLGVALFLGMFEFSGRFLNLARLDGFFLLLLLAGFFALRFAPGPGGAALAGLLFGLAFFAKQTALVAAAPALLLLALVDWRRAAIAGAALALALAAGIGALQWSSEGWFGYFAFTVPRAAGNKWLWAIAFWSRDIGRCVLPAAVATGLLIWLSWRRDRDLVGFYLAMLGGCFLASFLGRLHQGGHENALLPLYTCLAILMPLALARLTRGEASVPLPLRTAVLHGMVLAQLIVQLNDPSDSIPGTADRRAGDHWLAFLRGIDGEVMVMNQRYIPLLAGKEFPGLDMPVTDVLRVNDAVAARLKASILDALATGKFAGVVDPLDFVRRDARLGPPVAIPDPLAGGLNPRFVQEPKLYYPVLK